MLMHRMPSDIRTRTPPIPSLLSDTLASVKCRSTYSPNLRTIVKSYIFGQATSHSNRHGLNRLRCNSAKHSWSGTKSGPSLRRARNEGREFLEQKSRATQSWSSRGCTGDPQPSSISQSFHLGPHTRRQASPTDEEISRPAGIASTPAGSWTIHWHPHMRTLTL